MVGNSHLRRQLRELYKCPSFEEQLVEQGKEKDFFNAK